MHAMEYYIVVKKNLATLYNIWNDLKNISFSGKTR